MWRFLFEVTFPSVPSWNLHALSEGEEKEAEEAVSYSKAINNSVHVNALDL